MKVLIVFAHPEPKSFNGQLVEVAKSHLESLGHQVDISDLFKEGFKASADRQDFAHYSDDFFDLQKAQQQSQLSGQIMDDIKKEQDKLLWADTIIFQFPLWWYSVPAPLKGYLDRVLSVGFAYGGANALYGKKVMISTTTGAPKQAWTNDQKGTMEQVLFPITRGTFALLGLRVQTPFIVYGAKRMAQEEKSQIMASYKIHLENLMKDV